jgi:hypothetical protein
VIGIHSDLREQFLDPNSTLLIGGGLPDGLDVELFQHRGHVLESAGQVVEFAFFCLDSTAARCSSSARRRSLDSEQVGTDLVRVVEVQKLATLRFDNPDGASVDLAEARCPAFRRGPASLGQMPSDSLPQWLVVSDETTPKHRSTFEATSRPPGHGAALSPMSAPEQGESSRGILDRGQTPAEPTPNAASEQLL